MQIQSPAYKKITGLLRRRAADRKVHLVIEARIAVSPQEATILGLQPDQPLQVIHY